MVAGGCQRKGGTKPVSQGGSRSPSTLDTAVTAGEVSSLYSNDGYSNDGGLRVEVFDEGYHRSWWYASKVRLHYTKRKIRDEVFGEGCSPGSVWYPLFEYAFLVPDPHNDVYLLLGWTAASVGLPTLHAWKVTIGNNSMEIQKMSFSALNGCKIHLVVDRSSGSLVLFIPENPDLEGPDPGGYVRPCMAIVNDEILTEEWLRKHSTSRSPEGGFWFTRPRFMWETAGPGRFYTVTWTEKTATDQIPAGFTRPDF
jgi:hypothetical protein